MSVHQVHVCQVPKPQSINQSSVTQSVSQSIHLNLFLSDLLIKILKRKYTFPLLICVFIQPQFYKCLYAHRKRLVCPLSMLYFPTQGRRLHIKFGRIIIEVKLGNKFIVKMWEVSLFLVCVYMYTLACVLISGSNLSQILISSHLSSRRIFGSNAVSFSSSTLFIVNWLNNKRSNWNFPSSPVAAGHQSLFLI